MAVEVPDWALRDPHGWERAECSPLMRGQESLWACTDRVQGALAVRQGRPWPAIVISTPSSNSVPPEPEGRSVLGGRCRQVETRSPDGSSRSSQLVCGNDDGAAAAVLEALRNPD
jgi:hypothetical protein